MNTASATPSKNRRVVLLAGRPSHPTMMHQFNAGCILLKKRLDAVPGIDTALYTNGWPEDPGAFGGADALFLFMDGGAGHAALQGERLEQLAALVERGVGLGCAHYAVEVPAEKAGRQWQEWIGGYYEHLYSVNPIWEAEFRSLPEHPITRGVRPFRIEDEWYFNMRFRPGTEGVTPILAARPSDAVRQGPYVYPKGPYDHIIAAAGREEVLMWCVTRPDGGRGFGFTGGHFHLNWGNDDFRKIILNAILWSAGAEVPEGGVPSSVAVEELYTNLDDKPGRPAGPPPPAPGWAGEE
jgi:type 1 glutamine amidotransferase